LLASEAQAQCSPGSTPDTIRTITCTGTVTGQQNLRGGAVGEKLVLESGSITNTGGTAIAVRDDRNDVTGNPLTVEIKGGTVDASGTAINFDMGRNFAVNPNGQSKVVISGGTITADGGGININHRSRTGNFGNTGGSIDVAITGGTLGTAADRIGTTGLAAGIGNTTNAQDIDVAITGGSIFATQRGLSLTHAGTGTIDLDIGTGATIDTLGQGNRGAGVYISRNGDGAIAVDNAGTITSAGFDDIYILNEADGAITLNHKSGGTITSGRGHGIYVRQGSGDAGGNGAVTVTSAGDITAPSTGIFLDLNRGDATADDAVSVTLTGGTIAARTGVQVTSRTQGGLTFGLTGGSIGTVVAPVGQTGVSLSLTSSTNAQDLDVDITGGTIFARWRGLSLTHAGTGDLDLTLGTGSRITTQVSLLTVGERTLTRGAGIYAQHSGTGDLGIINSGTITAGFQGIEARRTGSGALTLTHTGTITASRGPGIAVRHDAERTSRKHDVDITIQGNVTTTDPNQTAVRAEARTATGNAGIRIRHTAGTLRGNEGIFAGSLRFSGSTHAGPVPSDFQRPRAYAPSHQPVVWVEIGGGPGEARIIAGGVLASRDEFAAAQSDHQAGWVSRGLSGTSLGRTAVDGVTVAASDYLLVGSIVAAGDKGVTGITPELRTQFRDVKRASILYGQADSKPGLGNLLDPRNLVGAFSGDLSDNAAIDTYLNTSTNLAKFREFTLSAKERAVLESMYGTGDLETALAALPSAYTDDYKNTVRWYDGAYNDADLRVDVRNNGIIESATGDGIRLIRRWVRDRNGAARVVIHEGGSITAHRYGIRMRGAGMDAAYALGDFQGPLRKHFVTVHGRVVSTGPEGAALAFLGGGEVTLGPTAHVRAASGTVIKIDDVDPGINLILVLEAADGEDAPALFRRLLPGRIDNGGNDANYVVFVRDPETKQVTRVPLTSLRSGGAEIGAYEVGMDRMVLTPQARATDALPIVLTDMMVEPVSIPLRPRRSSATVATPDRAAPGSVFLRPRPTISPPRP